MRYLTRYGRERGTAKLQDLFVSNPYHCSIALLQITVVKHREHAYKIMSDDNIIFSGFSESFKPL